LQNEIVYQKPEDFEFRVVKAGTEQLPYKNGKTAEFFVGENNCVQLDRVFPLSGTKKISHVKILRVIQQLLYSG